MELKFIALLLLLSKVHGDCLDGFEHHGDRCYKLEALEASWVEAKMYCRILGSELIIIENAAEEAVVEGMLTRVHGTTIDEAYWLSGSDMIQERDWRWMTSDGHSVPMVYTNWLHGRPDNVGGNQNCLSLHYHRGKSYWDDENCNTLHSFICETAFDRESIEPVG